MRQITWSNSEPMSSTATAWRLQAGFPEQIGHATFKLVMFFVAGVGFLSIEGAFVASLLLLGVAPKIVSFCIGLSIPLLLWIFRRIWRFAIRSMLASPFDIALQKEGVQF